MKTVGAAKFKQKCLSLLNHLDPAGLAVARHGKPVARVVPYERGFAPLIGSLKDKIAIHGDLTRTGSFRWHRSQGLAAPAGSCRSSLNRAQLTAVNTR